MSTSTQRTETTQPIPPIVLLIGANGRAEQYTAALESEGLWVSAVPDPTEAVSIARELRPDIVVADFSAGPCGDVVHMLKRNDRTQQIPVIVLRNARADVMADGGAEADLCITPPAVPHMLASHVRELVESSRQSREAMADAPQPAPTADSGVPAETAASPETQTDRPCPKCAQALDWIERGRLAGAEYDYYRWCRNGCGLYCYDTTMEKWIKLT